MEWIIQNIGTIMVAVLLAATVSLAIWKVVQNRKSGKSACGCGCSGCPSANQCNKTDF